MTTALDTLIDDYDRAPWKTQGFIDAALAERDELVAALRCLYDPCDSNGRREDIEALLARYT